MTAIHTHSKILKSTHFHWRFDFLWLYIFGPLWRFDRGADKKRMWWQKDEQSFFDSWNMGLWRFPIWDWVAGAMTKPKSKPLSYNWIDYFRYLTWQTKRMWCQKMSQKTTMEVFWFLKYGVEIPDLRLGCRCYDKMYCACLTLLCSSRFRQL